MPPAPRDCPFCGGPPAAPAFPYATHFAGSNYRFVRCGGCATRFIDPLPSAAALAKMYATGDYHDVFYDGEGQGAYQASAARLKAHLAPGAQVLDYGCGAGHLLRALAAAGLDASGAEFSAEAAANAAKRSGLTVYAPDDAGWRAPDRWDCIHLGDVIEHLPDPRATLTELTASLKPGGILSAEGPLEANRSLVHLAARTTGWIKRAMGRGSGSFVPYHLVFATAASQRALFGTLAVPLGEVLWQLEETGWPYLRGGAMRNAIALAAIGLARLPLIGAGMGNRYIALYRKG